MSYFPRIGCNSIRRRRKQGGSNDEDDIYDVVIFKSLHISPALPD